MRMNRYLKNKLRERNISQRELAIRMGLSQATISKYVNGSRIPSIENCCLLSTILDVPIDDFIRGLLDE
jgi:transcriptional regulator with XRE-family HTH domain